MSSEEGNLKGRIEAILFVAGEAVPIRDLARALQISESETREAIRGLRDEYDYEQRGFLIKKFGDHVQLATRPLYSGDVVRLLQPVQQQSLSQAAMETLAVVAYFQPVTRAYIEQVRGVDSTYSVSILSERGLIEECGRLEAPGRPAVFRTTDVFLRTMGITRLSELPVLPEVSGGEGLEKLQSAIDKLTKPQETEQNSAGEDADTP